MESSPHILWALFAGVMHTAGVLSALNALLCVPSSQSAIAWAISCVTFPYFAVPAYWLLGRNRFRGYVSARRSTDARLRELVGAVRRDAGHAAREPGTSGTSLRAFEKLARLPFTQHNRTELLIDGNAAFDSIFNQIARARDYVLVQFFIVRDDALSRRMADALAARVREGVRVFFLYDHIGSRKLPPRYLQHLRASGIQTRAFKTTRGLANRFQINFRNHRKLVLVDGRWAATGGANLGEEYLGRSERFGAWRDTLLAVSGPAVHEMQLAFVEDWFFITGEIPALNWGPHPPASGGAAVLVLPTGPADELPTCGMMFCQAVHAAEKRLWITSPYFVPDEAFVRTLQLAAMRGVDVRILLPDNPDHLPVYWASFTYLEELERTGVRFFRYTRGLLHEKVVLADDSLALIGTANTDNRSFHLNFELTLLVYDRDVAARVKAMLEEDFTHSRETGAAAFHRKPLHFRLAARLSRLLSPIL